MEAHCWKNDNMHHTKAEGKPEKAKLPKYPEKTPTGYKDETRKPVKDYKTDTKDTSDAPLTPDHRTEPE